MVLRINEGVRPKRKPNFTRWMMKHGVSSNVCSSSFAISRGIESMYKSDQNL
jgi:hypothetical protein